MISKAFALGSIFVWLLCPENAFGEGKLYCVTGPNELSSGPAQVFFDQHSDHLTGRAIQIVTGWRNYVIYQRERFVGLIGHIDGSEDSGLARRRAETVVAYLKSIGVRPSSLFTRDAGISEPLMPVGKNVAEPQNRYVSLVTLYPVTVKGQSERQQCIDYIQVNFCGELDEQQMPACNAVLDWIAGQP